jgi:transcriptional regulator EpsA
MRTEKTIDRIAHARAKEQLDAPVAFGLNEDERDLYLRIVADSLKIRRHYELFLWLQGDLQTFLPHEILLSAWGNFAQSQLNFDLISVLPGVRTADLERCDVSDFVKLAHLRWVKAGRSPAPLGVVDVAATLQANCNCSIHMALRSMRSLVVHGVRDERGSPESLYIALHTSSLARGRPIDRFSSLVDALVAPIDIAFRKVGALATADTVVPRKSKSDWLDLSIREQEILSHVCSGKTNIEIAATLSISPFTVKNHVQRIFRKIGASNRTEAAAKYNQAMRTMERVL